MHACFAELSVRVLGNCGAPEFDGRLVVEEFRDLPGACEAIEDELCSIAPDSETSGARVDKKFGHAKVDLLALVARRPAYEREANRAIVFEDDKGVSAVVSEPASHQLGFLLAVCREHPGVHAQIGEVVEILWILALNPEPILRRVLRISNTDRHDTSGLIQPPPFRTDDARRFKSTGASSAATIQNQEP